MAKLEQLERRVERERAARKQAEALLEEKSRQLFEAVQVLEQSKIILEKEVEERKQGEEVLRSSEAKHRANQQRLNAVMNSVADAVITLDGESLIQSFNRGAERIFGYSITEVLGKPVDLLLPASAKGRQEPFIPPGVREGDEALQANIRELTAQHKDGFDFPLELSVSRMDVPGENLFVGVCRDISRRKQREEERLALERELSQSQKMESLGTLSGGIAHEINTPIQYVGDNNRFLRDAFADLAEVIHAYGALQTAAADHQPAAEVLAKVADAVEQADVEYLLEEVPKSIEQSLEGIARVAKIVQAIKEFSHPGSVEKSAIDLNSAIDTTATVTRNQWKYVADLEFDFAQDLPLVPCLPGEINQVFLNLIVNAAHAIEERHKAEGREEAMGKITIATLKTDDCVEIRITDSGTGIPDKIREKIFDPFFTTKEPGKGTGQGLSICHTIVTKKHGGTLDIESEPGEGTTFIVRLPMVEAAKGLEAA